MIDHDDSYVFNASAFGPNYSKRLLETGKKKDALIRLGYIMDFGEGPFKITVENTGKVVNSMADLTDEIIDHDLLSDGQE